MNRREYNTIWSRRKRAENQEIINKIKLDAGCLDCGYREHPAALDFDHIDPSTKLFDISQCMGYSIEKLMSEIAKCVVRCANHHRIKTYEDRWADHYPEMELPPKNNTKGEDCHMSILTEDQVREIRRRFIPRSKENGKGNRAELAEEFKVLPTTIWAIVTRRTWKHVV